MLLGINLSSFGISIDIFLVLCILLLTTFMFVMNIVRTDVVAVIVLVLLGMCNILPPDELFSGFSSEAVISLIAVTIMGAGLEATGISVKVARWLMRFGTDKPRRILFLTMGITGFLASFMRSIGTASILLPIINKIHNRSKIDKAYLLMPMAFCSILGGMLTMVGTGPLIILNSLLANASHYVHTNSTSLDKYAPFGIFEVFPLGLALLIAGMGYFMLVRSKEEYAVKDKKLGSSTTKTHFRKIYGKEGEIFELKILANSPLIGKTICSLESLMDNSMSILGLLQGNEEKLPPLRGTILKKGAIIAMMGTTDLIQNFANTHKLKASTKLEVFAETLHSVRAGFCEAVIPPSSNLIGQEVRELHMKRKHHLNVLALVRGGEVYHQDALYKLILRSGDTLGMYSDWAVLREFEKNPDFFVLTNTYPHEKVNSAKMPVAVGFFLLAFLVVILRIFPISVGLLLGAVGMIATGVLTIDEAYEKVSWKSVFLLAGLLPLGLAMEKTGTTDWIVTRVLPTTITTPIWVIELLLAILATSLALIISNVGTTVLLVPIAMDIAVTLNAEPRLFALTVAMAASNTFILPTHQVNALISGPGNYSTRDFITIGGWMTVIYLIVLITCMQVFF